MEYFQLRALLAQGGISRQFHEIALLVADMPGKLTPCGGFHQALARKLLDPFLETSAQLFVAHGLAIRRDDRIMGGRTPVLGEVKQGRHKFSPRQVARSAKNDKYRRFELISGFRD